jgi:hyperosmotically inducible protein
MIRSLVRLMVAGAVLAAVAGYYVGYRYQDGQIVSPAGGPALTLPEVEAARARDKGAEIGHRVAQEGRQAKRALSDVTLTGKIKSKVALDDTLDGSDLDVDTTRGVVTISGTVRSSAQKERALQLARETRGVASVTDRIAVR